MGFVQSSTPPRNLPVILTRFAYAEEANFSLFRHRRFCVRKVFEHNKLMSLKSLLSFLQSIS